MDCRTGCLVTEGRAAVSYLRKLGGSVAFVRIAMGTRQVFLVPLPIRALTVLLKMRSAMGDRR